MPQTFDGIVSKPAKPAPEIGDVDYDQLEESGKLASLTVPYLKAYCVKHKLSTAGLKAEVLERVTQHIRATRAADEAKGIKRVRAPDAVAAVAGAATTPKERKATGTTKGERKVPTGTPPAALSGVKRERDDY
jgi:hypothetical protein